MSRVIVIDKCEDCVYMQLGKRTSICQMMNKIVPRDDETHDEDNGDGEESVPDWCPLQPLPERELEWFNDDRDDYERGWNACLNAIIGDSKETNLGGEE